MATTLATFRAWLRLDLADPAGSSQRFADADLDRAVARALADYSLAAPWLQDAQLMTVPGSRELSLASLAGLQAVEEVEWPTGRYPPALVPFWLAPDRQTLTLLVPDAPTEASTARVRWASKHTVDLATSTVPEEHEALVALGAYGYACSSYSTPAADNFRYGDGLAASLVDDTAIPVEWRRRSEAALLQFRVELERLRQRRARVGRPWVTWAVGSSQ